jgi:hypothetical protein
MLKEFKEFISRGNVMDMAVGIIMGAAFTAIVNSMVGDLIMPIIGVATSGVDFADKFVRIKRRNLCEPQGRERRRRAGYLVWRVHQRHHQFCHRLIRDLHAGQGRQQTQAPERKTRRQGRAAPAAGHRPAHGNPGFIEEISLKRTGLSFAPSNFGAPPLKRAHSSAGRALAWHARGRRFDPDWVHHFPPHTPHILETPDFRFSAMRRLLSTYRAATSSV